VVVLAVNLAVQEQAARLYSGAMKPFEGVFTPIITPFHADGTPDEEGCATSRAVDGDAVTGRGAWLQRRGAQLDDTEADWIIDIVRSEVPRNRPLIAGTGRESTRATIAATRRAAAAGVDAALVRTPAFFKSQMTTDVFVRHYSEVADASPIPVLLYNVSMFTGVNLSPDAVSALACHPNIVGMKESGSDIGLISEYIALTPDDFTVLAGSATLYALCAGCDGRGLVAARAARLSARVRSWTKAAGERARCSGGSCRGRLGRALRRQA
jgi:4-hydroxy-2-oxoglutarate aldolase